MEVAISTKEIIGGDGADKLVKIADIVKISEGDK